MEWQRTTNAKPYLVSVRAPSTPHHLHNADLTATERQSEKQTRENGFGARASSPIIAHRGCPDPSEPSIHIDGPDVT
jgi:hypothetical protein